MLDDAFLALVATPIPGDAPGGRNVRYDEPYTSLEAELGRLDNPAGGEPDWKKAIDLAKAVLSGHSKDIMAVSWATYAGLRLTRLTGLAIGLAACRDLLMKFWDTSFPAATRVKARRNALEWLGERAGSVVTPADIASPQGKEALTRCLALIDELEKLARERFEGEDSGLLSLSRSLKDLSSRSAPAAAPAVAAAGAATAPAAAGAVMALATGPVAGRQEAIDRLQEITDFFQRTEPHSPMGFLLARALAWNSKSFQDVMLELLRNKDDAQRQVFDDLGLKLPPKNR